MMLASKIEAIRNMLPDLEGSLEKCSLCVRSCGVDRIKGEKGFCGAGRDAVVVSRQAHHGEEPPLSGRNGSGTIFFSRCVMRCVYCQNWKFSQTEEGSEVSREDLAWMMMELQEAGCHNINLVSPTHYAPAIVGSIGLALEKGLDIPIVYNTGGYDSFWLIGALRGIVDVYLPDMRYSSDEEAVKYSSAPGYVGNNRKIVAEMNGQIGVLKTDRSGIAVKGLIVRLLVLPEKISGTENSLEFLAKMNKKTYISLMSQYYPAYRVREYEKLSRRLTAGEYRAAVEKMKELGLENGWVQPFEGGFDPAFAGENLIHL